MTLDKIAERLIEAKAVLGDTPFINVSAKPEGNVEVLLTYTNFLSLFAGKTCHVRQSDVTIHLSLVVGGCIFKTNKPLPLAVDAGEMILEAMTP